MKLIIDNSTYIFLLLSFLSGYFEYIYLLLITIFVHELGHLIFGLLINIKSTSITIYPFGGLTTYSEELNITTNKELIVLLGGIIFQLLFIFLITLMNQNNLIEASTYNKLININKLLISFNFMPILPLDGGKLINILLDKIFCYKLSFKITIIISIITSIIFLFKFKTILSIILFIFLMKSLIEEVKEINIKYNKFLLERYINNYNFNKTIIINNINNFKRDKLHIINNIYEKEYLKLIFDRIS